MPQDSIVTLLMKQDQSVHVLDGDGVRERSLFLLKLMKNQFRCSASQSNRSVWTGYRSCAFKKPL